MPLSEIDPDSRLEYAFLAAVLMDPAVLARNALFDPDDLVNPDCASAYAAILNAQSEGAAISAVTVHDCMGRIAFDDEKTLLEHLQSVGASKTSGDEIVAALGDAILRRKVQEACVRITETACQPGVPTEKLLAEAMRQMDEVHAAQRPKRKTSWRMAETAAITAVREEQECIKTNLSELDRRLGGGLPVDELIVVGARPGMGKTALATGIARRAALNAHSVLIFSLEMSVRALMLRMASDAAWTTRYSIAYQDASAGLLNEQDSKAFEAARRENEKLTITIDEQSGLTVADIAARVRREKDRLEREDKSLDLVIVDHMGKVRPSGRYSGQRVNELAETSDALARIAKSENVAVLALHQLNRSVESRDDKQPTLSDLRDSGAIEQDADVVMFLYRLAYYLENVRYDDDDKEASRVQLLEESRNELEVTIAKSRNGPTGKFKLYADMAANSIRDKWRA